MNATFTRRLPKFLRNIIAESSDTFENQVLAHLTSSYKSYSNLVKPFQNYNRRYKTSNVKLFVFCS